MTKKHHTPQRHGFRAVANHGIKHAHHAFKKLAGSKHAHHAAAHIAKKIILTGTGSGSKKQANETRQGYKGMTESHTKVVFPAGHNYKISKELTLPSRLNLQTPYQHFSNQNQQSWRFTRTYFSGVDIESIYTSANAEGAGTTNVPPRDAFSIVRNFLLDSVHVENTICNTTEGTIELDIYWLMAKTNMVTSIDPVTDFQTHLTEQEANVTELTSFNGLLPTQVSQWKNNWKILSRSRVLLEEASYHRSYFTFHPQKHFNMARAHQYGTLRDLTCYCMIGIKGLPLPSDQAINTATDANVGIAPAKICMVENATFTTRMPLGTAQQNNSHGAPLTTQTHLYTKNEGSGVVEDMIGAATAAIATQAEQ